MKYRAFNGDDQVGREIALDDGVYRILPESRFASADEMAFVRQGRKAQVYKLLGPTGVLSALKVFYRGFTLVEYAQITLQLREFGEIDGLRVCQRRLIGEAEAAAAGEPGLAFAVLMPWIEGVPWAGVLEDRQPLSDGTALAVAAHTAKVLARVEALGLAHADISSSNVLVTNAGIQLIDVEDMYHERFGPVPHVPAGSPGYAHPQAGATGFRNRYGDRFAGAVLLAEMLTWHREEIRESRVDTSLFGPAELGVPGPKVDLLHTVLKSRSPELASLFVTAWSSAELSACPSLADWAAATAAVAHEADPATQAELDELIGPSESGGPGPSALAGNEDIRFIPLFDPNESF